MKKIKFVYSAEVEHNRLYHILRAVGDSLEARLEVPDDANFEYGYEKLRKAILDTAKWRYDSFRTVRVLVFPQIDGENADKGIWLTIVEKFQRPKD